MSQDPLIAATLSYINQEVERAGGKYVRLTEGTEEHEKFKDHTKNPYHDILTKHGFEHKSTKHVQNPYAKNNPRADSTEHRYEHPKHGKSSVTIEQEHDPTIGHGGMKSKGHGFLHRHEQDNGIMASSSGDSKPQLHRSLSYHYGVPKNMTAPPLTASEKKYDHLNPHYKMNETEEVQEAEHIYGRPPANDHGFNLSYGHEHSINGRDKTSIKYPKQDGYKPVQPGQCRHCYGPEDECHCEDND